MRSVGTEESERGVQGMGRRGTWEVTFYRRPPFRKLRRKNLCAVREQRTLRADLPFRPYG